MSDEPKKEESPQSQSIAQKHGEFLDQMILLISSGGLLFIANIIFNIKKSSMQVLGIILLIVAGCFLFSIILLYFSFIESILKHNGGKSRSCKDTLSAIFIGIGFFVLYIYAIVHVVSLSSC